MFSISDREGVLARATELLSRDDRVEAVVLTGSLGRGGGDRWSDIDLDAVTADGADPDAVTREWEDLAYREWPVAHHYSTEFGPTRVRGFLLRDGLLLDLAWTPVGDFTVWAPVRVLFDRKGDVTRTASAPAAWAPTPDARGEAGFAAHDVLHACVAAIRGRRWQSVYFLQRLRNRTMILASERHGFDAQDFARVDDLPQDELDEIEATLVGATEPSVVLEAVARVTDAFLAELRRHDAELAGRLAEPLLLIVSESKTWLANANIDTQRPTDNPTGAS